LRQVSGVKRAEASFEKKEAYVLVEKDKTDPKPLVDAVLKAGYGAAFKRWGGPEAGK
jgi:copper chaperone CopZ